MSDPTDPQHANQPPTPTSPQPGWSGGMPPESRSGGAPGESPGGYQMQPGQDSGGYGAMPAAPAGGAPGVPTEAPAPVKNAVLLMYIRAALGVISLIVLLATKNSLKDQIRKNNSNYDADKLDSVVNAAVVIGVVLGIIFIVLYVLLAMQVAKGKNWARIVTWVISAIGVLSLLGTLSNSTAISKILTVVSGLISIAIIVLLAMGPSNQYFSKRQTY